MEMFGTSTKKYSLNQIIGKPQVVAHTAQDVNNLLGTVAQSAEQVHKVVADEQSYSLNKKYNQVQIQYNDAMTNSNGDLGLQTQAYDNYIRETKKLMSSEDVDEKVLTRFNAVALNDISRIRGMHDRIRHEYNKNRFYDKVTTDAITYKSLPPKDKQQWYKDKIELGKLYKLQPNEVAKEVITSLTNTYKASITPDTTLEQLKEMKDSIEAFKKVDDKLNGKDYFNRSLDTLNRYIDKKQAVENSVVYSQINDSSISIKDKKDILNNANLPKNIKQAYGTIVANQEHSLKLHNIASSSEAVIRNVEIPLKDVKSYVENRQKYDNKYTPEQAKYDMFRAKTIRAKNSKINSGVSDEVKTIAKEYIGHLQSTGTYDDPKKVIAYASILPYSASLETFVRRNSVGYTIQKNGFIPSFDNLKNNQSLYDTDKEWYKTEANRFINKQSSMLLNNPDNNNIIALGGMVKTTRQVGNIPTIVDKLLVQPDTTNADGIKQLATNIVTIDKLVSTNPELSDKILGTDKEKFMLYKAMMLSTSDNGNVLTAPEIQKVNDILANKEIYKLKPQDKIDAVQYFNDNYSKAGQTAKQQMSDKELFLSLKKAGVSEDDAIKQINSMYQVASGDNYSLVGVSPDSPDYKDIGDTLKYLSTDVLSVNNKDVFYTVNNKDDTLMLGTKEMPGQYDTGIPIRTKYNIDGSIEEMGVNDVVGFVRTYKAEQRRRAFSKTPAGRSIEWFKHSKADKVGHYIYDKFKDAIQRNVKGDFGVWNPLIKSAKTWYNLPATIRKKFVDSNINIIDKIGIVQFMKHLKDNTSPLIELDKGKNNAK